MLGFLFYVVVALLTSILVIDGESFRALGGFFDLAVRWIIIGGMAMSLALFYIQWRVIKAWCFWCILSAGTTFAMGVIVLVSNLIIV